MTDVSCTHKCTWPDCVAAAQRLTDEQIDEIRFNLWNSQPWPQKVLFERAFARAIEAAILAKE